MWLLCIAKFKTVEGYRAIHLGVLEENRLLFLVYLILEFLTQTNGFAFLAESRITEISSASWSIYWIEEKKKKFILTRYAALKKYLDLYMPPEIYPY